jgi:hypothetical protein
MDFLVKLSRNQKVMVPIVMVLALTILGGGYVIRSRDKLASQQTPQQQAQTQSETQNADIPTETPVQQDSTPVVDPDTPVSSPPVTTVELTSDLQDTTLTVHIDSSAPGICTMNIDGTETTVVPQNGVCTFEDVDTKNATSISVSYESDDHTITATDTITL